MQNIYRLLWTDRLTDGLTDRPLFLNINKGHSSSLSLFLSLSLSLSLLWPDFFSRSRHLPLWDSHQRPLVGESSTGLQTARIDLGKSLKSDRGYLYLQRPQAGRICVLPVQRQDWRQVSLFVCLFVQGVSFHSRSFHSFGYVTITVYRNRRRYSSYARHSWALSILTCHTNCAVTTCFNDLGLSRPEIEPWSPACEADALPLRHRDE